MKKTKNIIKTEYPYVCSFHIPDKEYDYYWLDFITFPEGFKRSEMEDDSAREEISNKFGKHAFRICFTNQKRIDELIEVLQIMKEKGKK